VGGPGSTCLTCLSRTASARHRLQRGPGTEVAHGRSFDRRTGKRVSAGRLRTAHMITAGQATPCRHGEYLASGRCPPASPRCSPRARAVSRATLLTWPGPPRPKLNSRYLPDVERTLTSNGRRSCHVPHRARTTAPGEGATQTNMARLLLSPFAAFTRPTTTVPLYITSTPRLIQPSVCPISMWHHETFPGNRRRPPP
jgi:hypothetical protein